MPSRKRSISSTTPVPSGPYWLVEARSRMVCRAGDRAISEARDWRSARREGAEGSCAEGEGNKVCACELIDWGIIRRGVKTRRTAGPGEGRS